MTSAQSFQLAHIERTLVERDEKELRQLNAWRANHEAWKIAESTLADMGRRLSMARRQRHPPNGNVPELWTRYSNCGDRVVGTKFIMFKTPLAPVITALLHKTECFTPANLLRTVASKRLTLRCVVAFSGTDRFFRARALELAGKLDVLWMPQTNMQPGETIGNDEDVYELFKQIADRFHNDPDVGPNAVLGVCSTRGINRIQYFVARYMVETMGVSVEDAIKRCADARGYDMEDRYKTLLRQTVGANHDGNERAGRSGDANPRPRRYECAQNARRQAQLDGIIRGFSQL